jgi:hypothetical protein
LFFIVVVVGDYVDGPCGEGGFFVIGDVEIGHFILEIWINGRFPLVVDWFWFKGR